MQRLVSLILTMGLTVAPTAAEEGAFVQVAAGTSHTCALRSGGEVECWGRNLDGESSPAQGPFVQLVAGSAQTCGLRRDGGIHCWGGRRPRELSCDGCRTVLFVDGRVHAIDGDSMLVAAGGPHGWRDPSLGPVREVHGGRNHLCGLDDEGELICDETRNRSRRGTALPAGPFHHLAAGEQHLCGIRDDGSLACWGGGWHTQVPEPAGHFTEICSGKGHVCAIEESGSVVCWGDDFWGQATPPTGSFRQLSCSDRHTCGITQAGEVRCWGDDRWGQVSAGDGERTRSAQAAWVDDVSAFLDATVARNSVLYCESVVGEAPWRGSVARAWLVGERGKVDPRQARRQDTEHDTFTAEGEDGGPAPADLERCVDIHWAFPPGGRAFPITCRWDLRSEGATLHCTATLGDDVVEAETTLRYLRPSGGDSMSLSRSGASCSDVHGWSTPPVGTFRAVSTTDQMGCGLRADDTVHCWGACYEPVAVRIPGRFRHIAGVYTDGQGIREDGSLVTWNDFGTKRMVLPGPFIEVAGRQMQACVVREPGAVECWGMDEILASPPQEAVGSLSSSRDHACALTAQGHAICWGADDAGQSTPPDTRFSQLAVGHRFSCGRQETGEIECWGHSTAAREAPSGEFVQLTSGRNHACALREDGRPECWGCGATHGHGRQVCESACAPPPGVRFQSLSAGDTATCGVTLDGTVRCWGYAAREGASDGPTFQFFVENEACYSVEP